MSLRIKLKYISKKIKLHLSYIRLLSSHSHMNINPKGNKITIHFKCK